MSIRSQHVRRHSAVSSQKGFSLVELMIGTMVIGLVLISSLAGLSTGYRMIESARDYTRSTQILQSEMEDLRTLNWTDLSSFPSWATFTPSEQFSSAYNNKYTCYRYIWTRKADQLGVRLYVVWYSPNGKYLWRSFDTYFTKEGINDYYYRSF
jgi:prepilin-type N-terminal cleavage/methylation domain-containing protein